MCTRHGYTAQKIVSFMYYKVIVTNINENKQISYYVLFSTLYDLLGKGKGALIIGIRESC